MKQSNTLLIIFAIAAVLITGFIFGNSMQSGEESTERSGQISEQIYEIVEPDSTEGYSEKLNSFVRKSAHVVEFAALGICVAGIVLTLFQKRRRLHIGAALFCVLAVAVLDEFIQSFTGRTSSVRDVLLDFAGGCGGMALMALGYLLICTLKNKKNSS